MRFVILLAALLPLAAGAALASTNAEVEAAIKTALVDKLGSDAETIRVAFFDGKATLSGQVTEDWTQELAKEVALYVAGVNKVENEIEAVKERSVGKGKIHAETQDSELETNVKSALRAELGDHASAVEVENCDGMVSLRGNLPDQARHDLAIAAATKVKGVKKVIDLLRNPA
jgi:osmotically-inducible protein OsmY